MAGMREKNDIVKYSNGKTTLVATDKLNIATTNYASVHTNGDIDASGKKMYSRIKLVAIDGNSNFVEYNLTPLDAKWLFSQINHLPATYEYSEEKTIDVGNGIGKKKLLRITRNTHDPKGNPLRVPWNIYIENGSGPIQKNQYNNNLVNIVSKSYKKDKYGYIRMTDRDIWKFFCQINDFIRIIENGASFHLYKKKLEYQQEIFQKYTHK